MSIWSSEQEKICFPFYVSLSMMKGTPDLHLNGFQVQWLSFLQLTASKNQKYVHGVSEEMTIDIVL